MTLGFFDKNKIEINEIGFSNKKKEILVISQTQYTVLAKLKQLRYYVKQLTPTLKESMEFIKKEKKNIDECDDKFEKYKLNLVYNKLNKIEKKEKIENKDDEGK
jgi:Na+/phosphate symporter